MLSDRGRRLCVVHGAGCEQRKGDSAHRENTRSLHTAGHRDWRVVYKANYPASLRTCGRAKPGFARAADESDFPSEFRVTIIADTGALYALVDLDDEWHERVAAWWKENRDPIVIPVAVLPEVCYLLHTRISREAESAFVRAVVDGEFVVEPLEPEDIVRAGEILQRYADLNIGFVDATVIATAERLDSMDILTTDRRHFRWCARAMPARCGLARD